MLSDSQLFQTQEFKNKLNQCIHCGLCLQACPTYSVLGTEMDTPRGRIAMIRAASDGRIAPKQFDGALSHHLVLCLTCRACETVCPSGVQYNALVEPMREMIEHFRKPKPVERLARWLAFRQMMPYLGRLKFTARLLWLYEVIGLQRLVRHVGVLPKLLKTMEAILPPIIPKYRDYRSPAPAIGKKRGQVALFVGCIQEAFLAPVNEATIRVLQRNGYEVHFPCEQTCCGAAQIHTGEKDLGCDLARRNIDAFLSQEYDAIISNAGGCGATLKFDYPELLKHDHVYAEKANQFSAKVQDISEFLIDHINVLPQGSIHLRAVYSDSCHLRHVQKVFRQPRELLKRIPGLELVELKQPDHCCGSAGVYNIIQSDMANSILDLKIADIAATQAEIIVISNTGCHMQLISGIRHAGLNLQVMHIVQVLDLSYQVSSNLEPPAE